MELNELKTKMTSLVGTFYTSKRRAAYSFEQEADFTNNVVTEGKQTYLDFVTAINADKTVVLSAVAALAGTEILDSLPDGLDAAVYPYVAGIMTTLTSDDQKLAALYALRQLQA